MSNVPTVIYLRGKSMQSSPSEPDSLPRKGAPIGALSYVVNDNILEVAFALQNQKDRWSRGRSRHIVLSRLELKRESCTKQVQDGHGGTFETETVPKYFRLDLPPREEAYRPYDVLERIIEAHDNSEVVVPERLVKTIKRMIIDNEARVRKLEELSAKKKSTAPAEEAAPAANV